MQTKKRPVYNEPQKMEFIREVLTSESSSSVAMSLFRHTAPIEFEKDADVSTFTGSDLTEAIESACGMRVRSIIPRKSMLQKYLRWCVEQGKPGAVDEMGNAEPRSEGQIRSRMMRNPSHLQRCLDEVFDPESDETQDNTFRLFFWMAYGGMPEEKIIELTTENIRLDRMEAHSGDDVAVIYRQGLPAVKNCIELKQFLYKNAGYSNGGIYRYRVPGDQLIRGVRGTPTMLTFRSMLSRKLMAKRKEGIDAEGLTYNRVWLSGVFYRIREAEEAGFKPDFNTIALESPQGIRAVNSGDIKGKLRTLESIAYGFRTDYERWKNAGSAQ